MIIRNKYILSVIAFIEYNMLQAHSNKILNVYRPNSGKSI